LIGFTKWGSFLRGGGRLKGAVGFRNVAVHAYRSIDWQIVHSITHERLDDFQQFARSVPDVLDEEEF